MKFFALIQVKHLTEQLEAVPYTACPPNIFSRSSNYVSKHVMVYTNTPPAQKYATFSTMSYITQTLALLTNKNHLTCYS